MDRRDESGALVIDYMFTIVLTLGFVGMVFTLLLWSFAEGVANSAADQGARAGSRIDVDSVGACEARAAQTFVNIFPGASVSIACSESAGVVTARIEMGMTGGVPPFSSTSIHATGSATKEVAPA